MSLSSFFLTLPLKGRKEQIYVEFKEHFQKCFAPFQRERRTVKRYLYFRVFFKNKTIRGRKSSFQAAYPY